MNIYSLNIKLDGVAVSVAVIVAAVVFEVEAAALEQETCSGWLLGVART